MDVLKLAEKVSPEEELLLSKFHASKFEFHYVLDSINWFINDGLRECIEAKQYVLPDGKMARIMYHHYEKPQFEFEGKMQPLFPSQAKNEEKTYSMSVWVKVVTYSTSTPEIIESESPMFVLLNIPVPVYSDACHLSEVPKNDFHPIDPGCNLIINGHFYIMLMNERGRHNILVLRIDQNFSMLPYIYQLTQTTSQTSYTSIFMDDPEKPPGSGSTVLGVRIARYVPSKYAKSVEEIEQTGEPSNDDEKKKKSDLHKHKEQLLNVLSTCYVLLASSASRAFEEGRPEAMYDFYHQIVAHVLPQEHYLTSFFNKSRDEYLAAVLEDQTLVANARDILAVSPARVPAAMYRFYKSDLALYIFPPDVHSSVASFFADTEEQFVSRMQNNPDLNTDFKWLQNQIIDKTQQLHLEMTSKETTFAYFHRLLRDLIPREQLHKCLLRFAHTEQFFVRYKPEEIFSHLRAKLKIKSSENASFVIEKYFRESMFPLLPGTLDKVNMLITMSCRLLQYKAGYTAVTDMSNWETRGLFLIGDLYYETLARKLLKAHAIITNLDVFNTVTNGKTKGPAAKLADMIRAVNIETKFMSEIRALKAQQFAKGKTKASSAHEEKTSLMLLECVSTAEKRAALTKHRNNTSTNSPSKRQSSVEANSFPVMDTTKATEGKTAGINKFIAQHTSITHKTDPLRLTDILLTFTAPMSGGGMSPPLLSGRKTDFYYIPVYVNSVLSGYTHVAGYANINKLKRYGKIDREASIVYVDSLAVIEIFCDSYRLIYPAVVCDRNAEGQMYPAIFGKGSRWTTPILQGQLGLSPGEDTRWKQMSFAELVRKGFIQYLDVRESENKVVRLAQTFASFQNHIIDLQFLRGAVSEALNSGDPIFLANSKFQLALTEKYWPTYTLLHPMAAYSVTCATVQFFDKLAPCRISYTEKMENHKMGEFLDDRDIHISHVEPMFHTAARVGSRMNELVGIPDRPSGKSIMFALYPDPSNEEDAFILSKNVAQLGKFHYMKTTVLTEKLEGREEFGRVVLGDDHPYHWRYINENGLPTVGAYVEEEDKIVGKYEPFEETTDKGVQTRWLNKSRALERNERGYVREVYTYRTTTVGGQMTNQKAVSVRIDKINQPNVADKFATLDVQKHILADLREDIDMPTIYETGEHIDGAFSPMGVLTRMAIGVLLRPLLGTLAAQTGTLPDTQGHKYMDVPKVMDTLEKHGFSRKGVYTVLDGITGKKRKAQIMVGPARLAALVRIGEDQLQVRGWEKNNPVTKQADTSKAASKGQKYTHYEGTACTAYGASGVVYDRMNECCDGETIVVCRKCSHYASYDPYEKSFVCNKCDTVSRGDGDQFGLFDMSRTLTYLSVCLMTIGRHLKPKYLTEAEYLGKVRQKEVEWITEETRAVAQVAERNITVLLAQHGETIDAMLRSVN